MRDMVLRYSGAVSWLGFFLFVLAAWTALFLMQPNAVEAEFLAIYGAEFWASLCAPITGQSAYGAVFLMWGLMSAAMMAPTFVPTLRTYLDLTRRDADGGIGFVALLGGYLAVWLGFSLVAAGAQLGLARLGLLDGAGVSVSLWLTAALLVGAGLYQFSPLKDACLSECREPLAFFMGGWQDGPQGAVRMGLKLGAVCLGCCWALMTLGFVGGVMNLVWMGVATVLMALEKLPEIGTHITRPLGVALVLAGVAAGFGATGIF